MSCLLIAVMIPARLLPNFVMHGLSFRTFADAQTVCGDLLPHLEKTRDEDTEPESKHVKDDLWKFELF